jgi:hypothetical protein
MTAGKKEFPIFQYLPSILEGAAAKQSNDKSLGIEEVVFDRSTGIMSGDGPVTVFMPNTRSYPPCRIAGRS